MIEKLFPIKVIGGWDMVDTLINNYYGVTFTEDFGAFKSGDEFSVITINYWDGIIDGYNKEGNEVLKTQKFKVEAI